jgi:hypothetical protein
VFLLNQFGTFERYLLRPGYVHGAEIGRTCSIGDHVLPQARPVPLTADLEVTVDLGSWRWCARKRPEEP